MNKIKKFAVVAAVALAALVGFQAVGQTTGPGFDNYTSVATHVLVNSNGTSVNFAPTNVTTLVGGQGVTGITNVPIWLPGLVGLAKTDFMVVNTNATTGAITAQTSSDLTNWTSFTNMSIITNGVPTGFGHTNTFYSQSSTGALVVINAVLFPFNLYTPAGSQGWVSPTKGPAGPFTNATITVTNSAYTEVGFYPETTGPYIRFIWTPAYTLNGITWFGGFFTATPRY